MNMSQQISLFVPFDYEILVQKNVTFFAGKEDRMTSVGSNFFTNVHMELTPLPIHTCSFEPDLLTLHGAVINE